MHRFLRLWLPFASSILRFTLCDALLPPVLVKTTETFKLSDLQYLELRLQTNCERLLVDAATGSSLCLLGADPHTPFESIGPGPLPSSSSLQRCDWMGEVLASGSNAEQLLDELKSKDTKGISCWEMEYLRLTNREMAREKTSYTSRALMHCVAQAIEGVASLVPSKAQNRIIIVDTIAKLFAVHIINSKGAPFSRPNNNVVLSRWSDRPFQYSSAINPNLAEIVVDILKELCEKQDSIKLLDPTCGSGTFLAFGLAAGFRVEGWDVNAACVEGGQQNIENLFPEKRVGWKVKLQDASEFRGSLHGIDCVVANFPWGQNTIAYQDDNIRILERLGASLRPGTPCAIMSKLPQLQTEMKRLGFNILGDAHVPQKDFVLPRGKKNKESRGQGQKGSSDCVVTIARSPS